MEAAGARPDPLPPERAEPDEIGVRELRQNASVYLERVRSGEEIVITHRGEPIAKLVPHDREETFLHRLVREGKARPPSWWGTGRKPDLPPPIPLPPGTRPVSEILQEMRDEERF